MKRMGMKLMAVALLCGGLMMATTMAKDQKQMGKSKQKMVTLVEDVMVNDQLIKQGTYRVKFDAANSQIIISDSDGDVVTTAKVNVRMSESKAPYNSISSEKTSKGKVMTALTFEGDRRVIMLDAGVNQAADGQAQ